MINEIKKISDVVVVSLSGSLDVSQQKVFKDKLSGIAEMDGKDMVADFSNVAFIDSSCLGTLVSLARRLREKSGDIKLSNLSPDVRSIFQITRLDKVFEIFGGVQEAVDSYYK
jgi:anti-sigma B factor antagonist